MLYLFRIFAGNGKEGTDEEIIKMIKEKFDLTPNGIINYLKLKEPIAALFRLAFASAPCIRALNLASD